MSLPGMNLAADIIRVTTEVNEVGDMVETETIIAEDVPCRLCSRDFFRRENLQILGGAAVDVASHIAILPADTDILTTDRIEVNETTYEVIWLEDLDQLGRHKEALVKHIGGVT